VAFREASPINAAFVQAMLAENFCQRFARDQLVENIFQRVGIEFRMFARQ